MNERDSEQVARMFTEGGYTVTKDEFDADAILVNTCSVRDQAEQKALGKMGHMGAHRQRKPHVVYGFMGCMAQSRGSELFQNVPHLDVVVGTQKYHKVFEYVDGILKSRLERRMDDLKLTYKGDNICDIEEEKDSQNTIKDHVNTTTDPTAFVSIMQGCNMKCSYCIVPDTRGRERGRPIADIVKECETLAERGVKEVTLLGQIVNLYGRTEFPKVDGKSPFVQLLEAVHEIDGIKRIRFTSPHPIGFRDDLIAAYGYLPKLCSHIHFPMQSGSDRVLKQMRRPYKNAKFIDIIEKIKAVRPDMSVTTDVIVGFPSETDEEFQETYDTMKHLAFDNAFVYRYSERRNTPAAERLDQIPEPIKEKRNQILLALVDEVAQRTNHALVGTIQEVLCTGPSKNNPDTLNSRTGQNKIVIVEGNADRLVGKIFKTKIDACTGFTLYGTPIIDSIED
ncbi:MAG: tRNA (N6-isopentenyl adenosine(37)-C2)-methylthiotransferase MiaB [Rubritalea sp.]|uniref:tRNA (N6-isopentenyl adenosine(37)-C2)-methylthiotransferase MiaB n=1 Tax=Rubritalea sp. TaxID=2109375 RepID=UPI00324287F0